MEIVATLLTDLVLDSRRFHGLLLDLSHSSLAGAIQQSGLEAIHAFGEADRDLDVRDIRVRCRPANTAPRAALHELANVGFEPSHSLEFQTQGDRESREDAWALVGLYAAELKGWIITSYMDFAEASQRLGSEEGLLHAPVGGRHKGVLIAASTLKWLTP
ncbi:MAG: hypothetical protein DWQ01_15065 [Planctomycetota bacterium]|nr:MAG: hypothetical protein DWQ01_15065 [Planctomycetota bacterium]